LVKQYLVSISPLLLNKILKNCWKMNYSTENETCEKKFNDVPIKKCLKIILVWIFFLSKFLKMKKNEWKRTSKNCMFKKCNGDFMTKMHFIGFFSMLMTIKKLIITTSNDVLCYLLWQSCQSIQSQNSSKKMFNFIL
jgi:hypothetical protein